VAVYVKMLGPAQLNLGQEWLELPWGKASALLYYLAYKGDWVSRDEIIYLFWPDLPEGQGRRNLRQLLSTTRRLPHAEGLEIEENRLRWLVSNDAREFRQAVAERNWSGAVKLYAGGTIDNGTAFNLTCMSYAGDLDMGLFVDPVAVDDPAGLRDDIQAAYKELTAL
jgi:hypothetical protein